MSNGSWRVNEIYVKVKGPVDLPVLSRRQPRPDDRLPALGQARR